MDEVFGFLEGLWNRTINKSTLLHGLTKKQLGFVALVGSITKTMSYLEEDIEPSVRSAKVRKLVR